MPNELNNRSKDIFEPVMTIKYYGVRGSLPTPLLPQATEDKIRELIKELMKNSEYKGLTITEAFNKLPFYLKSTYGGNTPCILVKVQDDYLIFDAGSGIRVLGMELMGQDFGKGQGKAKFFFSHTHWDHIQGLPFFIPIYIPNNQLEFYSTKDDIEERFKYQQDFRFFPVDMDNMPAQKKFIIINENETLDFGSYKVSILKLNHPGDSFAYRVEAGGKSFVYSTDVEFNHKNFDSWQQAVVFFKDADVLTFDSQYTLDESFQKLDWGHSSVQVGIDLAKNSNVKKLVLFHYDPSYSDKKIDEIIEIANEYKETIYPDLDLEIIPSYEGLEFKL